MFVNCNRCGPTESSWPARRGLCNTCYIYVRRHPELKDLFLKLPKYHNSRKCQIKDCDRKHSAKGYCSSHYTKFFPNTPIKICKKCGSLRPSKCRGLCHKCYQWARAHKRLYFYPMIGYLGTAVGRISESRRNILEKWIAVGPMDSKDYNREVRPDLGWESAARQFEHLKRFIRREKVPHRMVENKMELLVKVKYFNKFLHRRVKRDSKQAG